MNLSMQQRKTKSLRVFQFRKEDLYGKHFSTCSGPCAGGRLAKLRNAAVKSFQEWQGVLVRKLASLARYLCGIPRFQMFPKQMATPSWRRQPHLLSSSWHWHNCLALPYYSGLMGQKESLTNAFNKEHFWSRRQKKRIIYSNHQKDIPGLRPLFAIQFHAHLVSWLTSFL